MVGIILASHGEFASGILQSSAMIFGEQEQLEAVTLMPNEGPDDLREKLEDIMAVFGEETEILFLIDLWGGTPFNQANLLHEDNQERTAIVAGLNLPILLEALGGRMGMKKAHEVAAHIVQEGRKGIRVKPEELEPAPAVSEEGSSRKATAIPPGTVIGDGKINYVLTRIDSRLLHGQVATAWVKSTNPTRVIVVSDNVAKDTLRKTLITQAAPPGVKANVIPINKLIEIDKDPRFGNTRALLLFENPEDVVRVVEAGVDLRDINIGSMAHSEGKTMISNVLSVNEEDVEAFKKLKEHGASFDVRKVPGDSKQDLEAMFRKHNLI